MSLSELDSPSRFAGKPEEKISPLFKSFARELGDAGSPALRVKDALKRQFARVKLAGMFELTTDQFDQLLVDSGASTAWRPVIENYCAMRFVVCDSSSSAAKVASGRQGGAPVEQQAEGVVVKSTTNTLYRQLGAHYVGQIYVPPMVLLILDLDDPKGATLSQEQVSNLTAACCVWMFCLFAKLNIGIGCVRQIAKSYAAQYPCLTSEQWISKIGGRFRTLDRPDAIVRHTRTQASLPPPSPPLS